MAIFRLSQAANRPRMMGQSQDYKRRGTTRLSALGLSVNINPANIVRFGAIINFVLLLSLKMEADTLRIAREVVLE
jgi:hypothetical protein